MATWTRPGSGLPSWGQDPAFVRSYYARAGQALGQLNTYDAAQQRGRLQDLFGGGNRNAAFFGRPTLNVLGYDPKRQTLAAQANPAGYLEKWLNKNPQAGLNSAQLRQGNMAGLSDANLQRALDWQERDKVRARARRGTGFVHKVVAPAVMGTIAGGFVPRAGLSSLVPSAPQLTAKAALKLARR